MRDVELEISANERIAEGIYRMVLESRENLTIKPGQFINIRLTGRYLRRPISVCDWEDQSLTIVYKVVGAGTGQMSEMRPGEKVKVLLPLGNGFDVKGSGERPVLVGGGAGVPPMYGLAKVFINEGITPTVLLGFNGEKDIFYEEAFRTIGAEVYVATVDGSRGQKGFVTSLLEGLRYTSVYACGPEPMLKAIDDVIPDGIPAYYSFEERMGCGFG
ncbi:MAG: dihydroorotate dehydrogenase electron transfer subunit, partial [Firmicutes bacterium]|nr:dihydroorotate dehydrogenase electron transfer subunit [Bacillota bacterium]